MDLEPVRQFKLQPKLQPAWILNPYKILSPLCLPILPSEHLFLLTFLRPFGPAWPKLAL
jgi:hypothetical protein